MRSPARLLVPLLAASCGDSAIPAATPAAPPETQASAASQTGEKDVLFAANVLKPSPAVEDNERRVDPAYDQWRSEVLHDAAKKALGDFLKVLLDPAADEARFADLLDPAFEGASVLRPPGLEPRFDDGMTQVIRPRSVESELEPRERLAALGRDLRAPFGAGTPNPFKKIVSVDIEGPKAFATEVIVHLDGKVDGGLLQLNMEWKVGWTTEDDSKVLLRSLALEGYEEVRSKKTLFADLTEHVLGGVPRYAAELQTGVENFRGRTDSLIGVPFLGMQGIALGDVDGDGWDDLYVCQQAGLPNRLLRHGSDGRVVDDTARSRTGFLETTRSALLVDWDDDGDQDLIAAVGPGIVTGRNDGTGVFRGYGFWLSENPGDVYSIAAADPDDDGDLDVYCCRYSEQGILHSVPTPYHDANNGAKNIYFRNEGERFVDATDEVGFGSNNRKFSLACLWEDFDDDGDLDLFVANDFGRDNLFANEDGHFRDVAPEVGADDISAGMGASAADFDRDGDMDLLISNMFSSAGLRIASQADKFMGGENRDVHRHYLQHARGNTLLANRGDGTFEDTTLAAGVAVGGWAWGAKFVDLDNDGLEDIFCPDGFITNPDANDL